MEVSSQELPLITQISFVNTEAEDILIIDEKDRSLQEYYFED